MAVFRLLREGMTAFAPWRFSSSRRRFASYPLVRDEASEGACGFQQSVGGREVGDVAGRQTQDGRSAQKVRHGVDLGGLAAARRSDGLGFRPPFPPCAERCAFT